MRGILSGVPEAGSRQQQPQGSSGEQVCMAGGAEGKGTVPEEPKVEMPRSPSSWLPGSLRGSMVSKVHGQATLVSFPGPLLGMQMATFPLS